MNASPRIAALLAAVLLGCAVTRNASAALPFLDPMPWRGYFAVFESKRFQFGITARGKTQLIPTNDRDEPVGATSRVSITFGIEELLPDGTTRMKNLRPDTLESVDAATDQLEKVVIRGGVSGGATFEATVEQDHGLISIGGRVTDVGSLRKYPLRFTVRAKVPNLYVRDKKEERKDRKAFGKKIRRDHVVLKWTDGKRVKANLEETLGPASKELNGPGISDAAIELAAYKGRRLRFSASEHSLIRMWNGKSTPLHKGFWLHWQPDASSDPGGKSRFSFEVK